MSTDQYWVAASPVDGGDYWIPVSELPKPSENYPGIPNTDIEPKEMTNPKTGRVELHCRIENWEYEQLREMKRGPSPDHRCWMVKYPDYQTDNGATVRGGTGYTLDKNLAEEIKAWKVWDVSEELRSFPGYDRNQNREEFMKNTMALVDPCPGRPGAWGFEWFIIKGPPDPHGWMTAGLYWAFSEKYDQIVQQEIEIEEERERRKKLAKRDKQRAKDQKNEQIIQTGANTFTARYDHQRELRTRRRCLRIRERYLDDSSSGSRSRRA